MTNETTPEPVLSEAEGSPVISIQVMEKRSAARVVQWRAADGGLRRCVLPAEVVREALADGGLTEEELERGIIYGEDWAIMLKGVQMPTPETVAQALRDIGVWTAEQARKSVGTVRVAMTRAYAPVTTAILRGSRDIQKGRR